MAEAPHGSPGRLSVDIEANAKQIIDECTYKRGDFASGSVTCSYKQWTRAKRSLIGPLVAPTYTDDDTDDPDEAYERYLNRPPPTITPGDRTTGLGDLRCLPDDIICQIGVHLDLLSFTTARQTSHRMRNLLADVSEYKALCQNGVLRNLRALLVGQVANRHTILSLYSALTSEECSVCRLPPPETVMRLEMPECKKNFGGFLSLLTGQRVCIRCIKSVSSGHQVLSLAEVARRLLVTTNDLHKILRIQLTSAGFVERSALASTSTSMPPMRTPMPPTPVPTWRAGAAPLPPAPALSNRALAFRRSARGAWRRGECEREQRNRRAQNAVPPMVTITNTDGITRMIDIALYPAHGSAHGNTSYRPTPIPVLRTVPGHYYSLAEHMKMPRIWSGERTFAATRPAADLVLVRHVLMMVSAYVDRRNKLREVYGSAMLPADATIKLPADWYRRLHPIDLPSTSAINGFHPMHRRHYALQSRGEHQGKDMAIAFMSVMTFPFYHERPRGRSWLEFAVSCSWCAAERVLRDDLPEIVERDTMYTRAGYLEHFRTCERSQRAWAHNRTRDVVPMGQRPDELQRQDAIEEALQAFQHQRGSAPPLNVPEDGLLNRPPFDGYIREFEGLTMGRPVRSRPLHMRLDRQMTRSWHMVGE